MLQITAIAAATRPLRLWTQCGPFSASLPSAETSAFRTCCWSSWWRASLAFPSSELLLDRGDLVLVVLLGELGVVSSDQVLLDGVHRGRELAAMVEHGVRGGPDMVSEGLEVLVVVVEAVHQVLSELLRESV